MLAQLFQIAIHFYPGHPQLKILADSLDALIQLPSTKMDYYFVGYILMHTRLLAYQGIAKNS